VISVMARCTGQTPDRIREDSERDRFFDAPGAVKYGICDEVIGEESAPAARACGRGRDEAEMSFVGGRSSVAGVPRSGRDVAVVLRRVWHAGRGEERRRPARRFDRI
jgi:hypothetical protein